MSNGIILRNIEHRSIFCFPACIFEEANSVFFDEWGSEFVSLSFPYISPVKEFESSPANYLTLWSYNDIVPQNGVHSVSLVLCNNRCDIFPEKEKVREHYTIVPVARSNLYGKGDRWIGISNHHKGFVSEEVEVLLFGSSGCILIRPEGINMSGVNGEGGFFLFDTDSLRYEIREYVGEFIRSEFYSEVMEGCVEGVSPTEYPQRKESLTFSLSFLVR